LAVLIGNSIVDGARVSAQLNSERGGEKASEVQVPPDRRCLEVSSTRIKHAAPLEAKGWGKCGERWWWW
jgi:hypothetical protein